VVAVVAPQVAAVVAPQVVAVAAYVVVVVRMMSVVATQVVVVGLKVVVGFERPSPGGWGQPRAVVSPRGLDVHWRLIVQVSGHGVYYTRGETRWKPRGIGRVRYHWHDGLDRL
jgi:hypothetical protein